MASGKVSPLIFFALWLRRTGGAPEMPMLASCYSGRRRWRIPAHPAQPSGLTDCSCQFPDDADNGNYPKFSTACGFALKVIKHQNDDELGKLIKEQKSTDTETADFISAFIKHKKIFQERDTNEVNIMNGLDLWGQKLQVLAVIKTLKNLGKTDDEYIVDYVVENYQVTPDYVRKLMKEQPAPLPEEAKFQDSSVPAHS